MSALRTLRLEQGAADLLVLLPGAYMKPEGFVAAGFFNAVQKRGLALDVFTVDLDLATISSGDAVPAIRDDVLTPARQRYQRVWLGGISLGGFLALAMAADHPDSLDGLCLLAPYPGSRLTTNTIARAGGLEHWEASPDQLADPEYRVWRWLKAPPEHVPTFVGYGADDRFATGMESLAACFPAHARRVVTGSHDWPAWRALWDDFLECGYFAMKKAA